MLGILGSLICAPAVCRIYYGKLTMEIMLNATLAGGVAIGTSSDLVVNPGVAMFIGGLGGILSTIGFIKIGPYL